MVNESRFNLPILRRLYGEQPHTIDLLPHTDEEIVLVDAYNAHEGTSFSIREIYMALMTLRKRGHLPKKGKRGAVPGRFSPNSRA